MVKHLNELAGSLKDHEKAVFLQVFQYRITEKKERLRSTHYEEVSQTFRNAAKAGVEFWEIQLDFGPEGVALYKVTRSVGLSYVRGDLAIKQSRALVSTFKKMKDYIVSNKELIGQREAMQLSMQTADNTIGIHKLRMDLGSVEKQMSDVMEQLGDVVTKSELAEMMNGFVNDENNGWLMYNTRYCSADVAYSSIYSQAKKSVYLIDNYIGLRTLVMLKNAPAGADIKIFSDNIGSGKLHNVEYTDFCREYPNIKLTMQHTGGIYHDRFIVLDYGTKDERVFLCGASSRDAGARITSIVEDFGIDKYAPLVKNLLNNAALQLP